MLGMVQRCAATRVRACARRSFFPRRPLSILFTPLLSRSFLSLFLSLTCGVVRRSPRSSPRCRLLASSMLFRAGVLRRSVTRVLLFILSNSRRLRWCAPRFTSSSSPLVVVSSSLLCVVPVPRVLLCAPSARGARSRCAALLARVSLPVCPVFHVCAPRSPLPSCRPASCVRPPRGFYAPRLLPPYLHSSLLFWPSTVTTCILMSTSLSADPLWDLPRCAPLRCCCCSRCACVCSVHVRSSRPAFGVPAL